jgi:hypothetical protein
MSKSTATTLKFIAAGLIATLLIMLADSSLAEILDAIDFGQRVG